MPMCNPKPVNDIAANEFNFLKRLKTKIDIIKLSRKHITSCSRK